MLRVASLRAVPALVLLSAALACGTAPAAPSGPQAPSGDPVQFTGLVTSVTGSCPSLTFRAASHTVSVGLAGSTIFLSGTCADIRRGVLVTVEGRESNAVFAPALVRFESDGPADAGLLTDVAAGGHVLFFRHAERDAGAIGTAELARADNVGTCLPGSELTAAGKADAEALGERFRRYGIAVQKVYASPTCRTMQMAQLAFGAGFETTRGLMWRDLWAPEEAATLDPVLRQLLSTPPEPGRTTVLLSHNEIMNKDPFNLPLVLEQAEAAVFRPLGGSYQMVGRIPKSLWMGRR